MNLVLQYGMYLGVLVLVAIPLGAYISKVMNGEKVFLTKIIRPVEKIMYRILRVKEEEEMNWKTYFISIVFFSVFGLLVLFFLQVLQGFLGGNPMQIQGLNWDLAFNTAVSFITNTNWQAYSGESSLSYLTQALGLTVQNFVSAGCGIAVLFALVRGFLRVKEKGIGNFWVDLTRSVCYILMPLSIIVSVFLISQGVVQSGKEAQKVTLVERISEKENGEVTQGVVPLGYAASQIAIKQLGTNGGGYFGTNSAHPLENPTWLSNFVEMISILLIPVALCFSFGRSIKNKKQGIAIFAAMFIMLSAALLGVALSEQYADTIITENEAIDTGHIEQAGGNMEGKEARFGIVASATWGVFTTAASNGSVNAMHDSFTPLGGMIVMLLMQLGEVVFGGVGCGLYGMLAFAILTVFIAGLMVGRTPEYLGKKIEPYEMKCAVFVCLATPVAILVGSGIATALPFVEASLGNKGAHGFSEVLYAYSSAGGNNGSAFAGLKVNTLFFNSSIGLCMLFARFAPMAGILAIAGSMAGKKKTAVTEGTLPTDNAMFVFLLIFVVLLIGALSFFPALALGPIAEFFS